MKNICFTYGYGPEGPLQAQNAVVMTNKRALRAAEVRVHFERRMINKNYFLVEKFGFPSLRPVACDALSNDDWHELISIEETDSPVTESRDVCEVLPSAQNR